MMNSIGFLFALAALQPAPKPAATAPAAATPRVVAAPPAAAPAPGLATVVVETDLGRIVIEVNVAKAPVTSANFLKYVDYGFYNGGAFHRAVRRSNEDRKDAPIEVVQARKGPRKGYAPIELETTAVTGLRHRVGTVSMARGDDPTSATSDFFICLRNAPALDFGGNRNEDGQGFAAFGRVIEGMDVVKKIHEAAVKPQTQNLEPPIKILTAARKK